MSAGERATLERLCQAVAKIEGQETDIGIAAKPLPLGIASIDDVLGGGLRRRAIHEFMPASALHLGPTAGFILALIARTPGTALWIHSALAGYEAGRLYGPGLAAFGVSLPRLIFLQVDHPVDVLWAMEEGLKSSAIGTVVGELDQNADVDLTATRRLALAARDGPSLGFLLRQQPSHAPNASVTRWSIAAASSQPDTYGGIGLSTYDLSLFKNRYGPNGRWIVTWNQYDRLFTPLSVAMAAPARDGPARAGIARAS